MKKDFLFFLITLFLVVSCKPEENPNNSGTYISFHRLPSYLSLNDAISEAKSFLEDIPYDVLTKGSAEQRKVSSCWSKQLGRRLKSLCADERECLYFINFNDSSGFAIVSSDPKKGVLGVSLYGHIDNDEQIDNLGLKLTIKSLEERLEAEMNSRGPDSIDHYEYGNWNISTYVPNTGYCPVKWNQGNKYVKNQYNYYCPDSSTFHCPAGCVAVAVAQLMSMYKKPASYGSHSFDWNSMISNSWATDSSGEYYVGRLLQQLGLPVNLDMNYSPSGSSSYGENIPRTFENFSFSNGGTYGNFYFSSLQELMSGHPIIITGASVGNGYHAWLGHGLMIRSRDITGYTLSGEIVYSDMEIYYYVLCNFGWGGVADGFYTWESYKTTFGPNYTDPNYPYLISGDYDFTYNFKTVKGIRQ